MTRQELAQDRLRCWRLIARCQKVNMPVPEKWRIHGWPPPFADQMREVMAVSYDFVYMKNLLDSPSPLYAEMKRRAK